MASRILDVLYKSQNDPDAQGAYNDCGPACVAMILAAQGQNVATADVYAASGVTQDRPLSFDEVRTAAARYDLPVSYRLNVTLQDVRNYIDQGTPVIALVKYLYLPDRQGQSTTGGHFVLVVGYDDEAGEIVINDPYYWGPLRSKGDHRHYNYSTWEQAWGRCSEDGNPNHSILIPQLSQPVPAIGSYTQPEPLPGVTTVYVLPAADAYNGLKLRPVRSSDVSGPAVFSGRALTVVRGPVTEGDATWVLVRTQSADDVAGWACVQRGGEAYIGNMRNATAAASISLVQPAARAAYVQPDVEKYGGLKLRPMRDIRLDGPVAHAGAVLNVLADPVGSGDNGWLLVTLQDGKDTAGWVRVRQGSETYVSEAQQKDITSAPVQPAQPAVPGDVWAIAPAGLFLRPQPSSPITKGMSTLQFGTHLTALGPEAGLDEKGRTWLQVRTDQGVVGWIPASASGDRLVSDSKPADPYSVVVLDTPPVRQAGGLRVRDTRNIDAPELDQAAIGERLIVYVRAVEADGTPWLWVKSPRGEYGWAREESDDVKLVSEPEPITEAGGETTPSEGRITQVAWPYGKCLVGVGLANPQLLEGPDLDALRRGRVEAIKLLTLPDPDQGVQVLQQVKSLYPNAFLACRLMAHFGIRIEPPLFAEIVGTSARKLYQAGVRYFEVHNEPNLPQEGLGVSWANGAEFGAWFSQVVDILRPSMPEAQFGFPGVSPQPNVSDFLDGATQAINAKADWIGIHCYWQNDGDGHWLMRSPDGGMYWRGFRDRYPDKLLMITEFSNNNPNVGYADKGRQYATYLQLLRHEPNLGAAFAFALNWPGQDNNHEGWVSDGSVTDIPGTLASIIGQPGLLG